MTPIIRHTKTHLLVLCPLGHLIESHRFGWEWAGSLAEAELGRFQCGDKNTRWHRLAHKCQGFGHPEKKK